MKRFICIASSLIFVGSFAAACQPASAPKIISASNNVPRTKMPMPPISTTGKSVNIEDLGWQMEDGKTQKFSDLKGKVLVLDFWATYCPPCLEEIPHLIELQDKHKDRGLVVIGLNVGGDDDRPAVPAFVKKLKITYGLGTPQDELTGFLFGGDDRIPKTFVFDRAGKMTAKFDGFDPEIKTQLDKAVLQALAN